MPNIRTYQQRISADAQMPGRVATAGDFGGEIGEGLQALGNRLQAIGDHVNKVRRETMLASATAKATQELQEYSFTLQNGSIDAETGEISAPPDPSLHVGLYQQKVKDITGRVKGEFKDDALYALFERDFGKVALRQSFDVRKNVIEKQRATALGEFNVYEDNITEVAAGADPLTRNAAVENYRVSLEKMMQAGVIDPVERAKREKAFLSRLDQEAVRAAIRKDPQAALDGLMSDRFAGLDPVARQKWIDTAIARHESNIKAEQAAEDKARRESEREERQIQDGTYRDAIDLAQQGKLTVAWVRANRENIAKSDYDNLMKVAVKGGSLGGGEGGRSSQIYADLRIRAGRGEDVRAEAKSALTAGNIKPGEFSTIVSEVEGNSAQVKGENWYRAGKDTITRSLAPSQINPGIDREVQARALDDWQRYSAENPNATPQERERVRDGIINSSRIVQSDDVLTSIPTPRFLVGAKQEPNIAGTAKATREAFERGEISKFEYDREGRNIESLERWVRQQQANKPKTDTKKGK